MGKSFARFARFCVHDIYGHLVDDIEPTRVRNPTGQLDRFHLGTSNVLDPWMVKAGPKSKPNFWVWNTLQKRLRELTDFDWNFVLGN